MAFGSPATSMDSSADILVRELGGIVCTTTQRAGRLRHDLSVRDHRTRSRQQRQSACHTARTVDAAGDALAAMGGRMDRKMTETAKGGIRGLFPSRERRRGTSLARRTGWSFDMTMLTFTRGPLDRARQAATRPEAAETEAAAARLAAIKQFCLCALTVVLGHGCRRRRHRAQVRGLSFPPQFPSLTRDCAGDAAPTKVVAACRGRADPPYGGGRTNSQTPSGM